MAILLDIIRSTLISAGVVEGSTGFKCFVGYAPDDQDQIVGLMPTGGGEQETHGGENVNGTFQAKIRTGQFAFVACEAKWRAVFNALQDANLSASGIYLIQAMNTEPLMWVDEKNRYCASVNFRVIRAKP